ARGVPSVVPVNAAVYVPFALSVTAPKVPTLVPAPLSTNVTVAPPEVTVLPAASFACSVTVVALATATDEDDNVTTEVAADAAPGVTVTVGSVVVIAEPLIVADTLRAVPA